MVLSLSIGMFCFIIATVYVNFEYSRNSNHKDADRVYRIMVEMVEDGRHTYVPYSFASEIGRRHPEIETVSMLDNAFRNLYLSTNQKDYIYEESSYFADSTFFNVFTFPLRYGSERTALKGVNNVVISAHLAEVLFQDKNPIGEVVHIHERGDFQVSGVLEEVPAESLLNPSILFTRELLKKQNPEFTESDILFTHIKVRQEVSQEELEASLYSTYRSLFPKGDYKGIFSERLDQTYWGHSYYDYNGGHQFSSFSGANKARINSIAYIALGIMFCAIIGYLSLSLGLSLKRSKEIGVRKVNGAGKFDIQVQLLLESTFYSLFALIITVVALEITSNYFTQLFGVPVGIDYSKPELLIKLMLFTLITGIISGLYPAFAISKLNPVKILSGYNSPQGSGFALKRVLLVVQLVVTVVLVFGTLVQVQQVNKMLGFDFGYNKTSLLAFQIDKSDHISGNYASILEEIQSINGVTATSGGPFPFIINGYWNLKYDNGDTLIQDQVGLVYVAPNYFDIMEIPMVEGKNFTSPEVTSSVSNCIVNEAMARQLGGNVVGQMINYGNSNRTIIGVSKDYTDWGLSSPEADPRIFIVSPKSLFHSILIKHNGENTTQLTDRLNEIWRSYETVLTPEITDLEAKIDYSAAGAKRATKLYGFLSTMVLVLSMMNLFGYSVMYAGSKLKNVSIRRILGAETIELFIRLFKPFFISLIISLLIAIPIGYWLMGQYLSDYAVRISLNALHAVLVSIVMFILILSVIGFQLFKVSRMNPVSVLKDE